MLKSLSDRLLSAVPPRYRWALPLVAAAILIFELSRLAAGLALLPWGRLRGGVATLINFPLPIAIVASSVAVLAFVIPMAGVVWALRYLHRRLFHRGTGVG